MGPPEWGLGWGVLEGQACAQLGEQPSQHPPGLQGPEDSPSDMGQAEEEGGPSRLQEG